MIINLRRSRGGVGSPPPRRAPPDASHPPRFSFILVGWFADLCLSPLQTSRLLAAGRLASAEANAPAVAERCRRGARFIGFFCAVTDRLTDAEIEALRQEMRSASEWMRQELRRPAPITWRPTAHDRHGPVQSRTRTGAPR